MLQATLNLAIVKSICLQLFLVCRRNPKREKTEEELEREVPVISIDYMGPKSKNDKVRQE